MQTALNLFVFSTSKNYASTFKIRSRLSDFFKHVHPDQLHQAPTKIKEQNLRSLTNFNAYIDAINQSKSIEGKQLKFYLSEKTNLKSKKFYSFAIQLPSIDMTQKQMSEDNTKKLVDNIVEVLNRKFLESKLGAKVQVKGKQKVEGINYDFLKQKQTKEQTFHKMVSKITPFDRKGGQATEDQRKLQSDLNSKYLQAEKQALQNRLKKSISFADTRSNKPMMWSRIATEESGIFKDFQAIFDELIDPRLIYFHESLEMEEIQTFKKNILPGSLDRSSYNDFKLIADVCSRMQSFEPPLCFYVHDKYSGQDIPGYFTIPFNFKPKQMIKQFDNLLPTILEQRQKYEEFFDYYCELKQQLSRQNNILLQETHFRNNNQIWMKILTLKRLQRYRFEQKTTIIIFDPQQMGIFRSNHQINNRLTVLWKNSKLLVSTDFSDHDLEETKNQRQL